MGLQIYNTLTQKNETFVPLKEGEVKIYLCGPTVYGLLHVGNFRGPIFFNLVRNWLEYSGYRVEMALNFTDVDDKIIARANEEGVSSEEVATKYISEYMVDYRSMGLREHTYNPKVTESMDAIVSMIGQLIANGLAYVVEGEVLFSVRSFRDYGKLSGKNIDDLQAGARVSVDEKKKDPMDFALWKPAKPGEPKWPSPWSDGRPGWHIECSAMIHRLFGGSIDIHGGGMDLIFPHHENEIAQSEGASDKPFVKYWMHNNMLTFGDKKMSKSIGNIVSARDFLAKYNAEILKYMTLSVHYRSLSDFSEAAIHRAVSGLARVYSSLNLADSLLSKAENEQISEESGRVLPALDKAITSANEQINLALNDDFNTPEFFAAIYHVIRTFNGLVKHGQKLTPDSVLTARQFKTWMQEKGGLCSLFHENPSLYLRLLDDMLLQEKSLSRDEIDQIVAERIEARGRKDYVKSDELRQKLTEMGISVQDLPQGSAWEVSK